MWDLGRTEVGGGSNFSRAQVPMLRASLAFTQQISVNVILFNSSFAPRWVAL